MQWTTQGADETAVARLVSELRVSRNLARLLAQRGIGDAPGARRFLRPSLGELDDPFALTHLRAAAERLSEAVDRDERILVFGDYDVDGVTSTAFLVGLLARMNSAPEYCVPRRLEEGYGMSREALARAFDGRPPDLLVAVDCGTNAREPIAELRERGVDVIVVDHHQAKGDARPGCIFVNPHVNDAADAPWRDLCAVGLVFKLAHGFLKIRRELGDPRVDALRLRDFLDLVALGTIADLVPLSGENRVLSWYGLRHLRAGGREGVQALAEAAGLGRERELVSADISFKLGPRINASGRLDEATLPIRMLLSDDASDCRDCARELDGMNRERQSIERGIAQEALEQVDEEYADDPGLVLHAPSWHPGVVGIVASRVSRRAHRPALVLGAEGDLAKGSGRSVPGVDLVAVLQRCAPLLDHWGGHPMAVGLSLDRARVPELRDAFRKALRELYPAGLPAPTLELAGWLEPEDLSEATLKEIDLLHPMGQGNEEPVFGLGGLILDVPPQRFGRDGAHFRTRVATADGGSMSAVGWRSDSPPAGQPVDLAVRFGWNFWNGRRDPQLTVVDWRISGAGGD